MEACSIIHNVPVLILYGIAKDSPTESCSPYIQGGHFAQHALFVLSLYELCRCLVVEQLGYALGDLRVDIVGPKYHHRQPRWSLPRLLLQVLHDPWYLIPGNDAICAC